ncbi:unnamed protein product [Mytilus coruscus]|uniref:DUF3504 domain-containing protein n=1 Tax=Mytilus coruscus TaxID=42192 RepID=A0A6J8AI14_MYTCO|nr:unnamed protein product [Mytilus coruscus]
MDIVGTEQDLIDATEDIESSQIALEVEEEIQLTQAAAAAENDFSLTHFVLDAATAGEANQPNFEFGDFDMSFLGSTDNSDSTNNRFSAVVSNEEITNLISVQKNKNTEKNTKWAMNVFNEWQGERIRSGIIMPDLLQMDYISMDFWIQRGVMRYCRDNGLHVNFFNGDDATFAGLRKVLDARMKQLPGKGLGTNIKKADAISGEDKEILWLSGVFGTSTATTLQYTIFFYVCKVFIGRSEKAYQGGLAHLKVSNKDLKHYTRGGSRCLYEHFETYLKFDNSVEVHDDTRQGLSDITNGPASRGNVSYNNCHFTYTVTK